MKTRLHGGLLVTEEGIAEKDLLLSEGKIEALLSPTDSVFDACEVIDCSGLYVSAGFVDIHQHGGGGSDYMDGDADAYFHATEAHLAHGTTSVMPTLLSADKSGLLRGIEGYSHLWLIWQFSEAVRTEWSPTVRPPRLGGNVRMGVFATRSPFRPNSLGLSSVKLLGVEQTENEGMVIHVAGADLMDGTPIFDIKPYIPYGDCHPDATGGFTDTAGEFLLNVNFPEELLQKLPDEKRSAAIGVLSHDPRPSYQRKPDRIYGLTFAGFDIRFTVTDDQLTVVEVTKA
jgi:tRNA-Thr(GGU) m(6)t(6)A37 methyltransferase TsaA